MKQPNRLTRTTWTFVPLSVVLLLDLIDRFASGRATRSTWEWAVTGFFIVGLAFCVVGLVLVLLQRRRQRQ